MPSDILEEEQISTGPARQVAWIVYVNGIEIPAVSASISYGVWAIPECQLTLVPDPVLHRLGAEDRVSVQVFYCDYWEQPGPQFRLMYDGEIVGWSYVNSPKQKGLTFSCVDYMQIFTQLFFFFMSSMDDLAVGISNEEIGMSQGQLNLGGYGALYPYSLFSQGLTEPSAGEAGTQVIERPIDFAYNIVKALIKCGHPNRTVPGANFFAPWTQRTNFHRRWIALPYLESTTDESGETVPGIFPILRAVQSQFAIDAVARMASTVGNAGSMWEMVKQVLSILMMEMQMLPTPPAVSANITDLVPLGPPGSTSAEGTPTILLGNYFVKPQFLFGLPPVSNVFFPSQVASFGYDENYVTQPTRMYFSEEALTSYLRTDTNTAPGLGTIIRDALAVAHPEEVNIAMRNAVENPGESGKNLLVYPEEFYKGPVVDRRPMPRWFMFLQSAQQGEPGSNVRGDTGPADTRTVAPGDSSRDVYRKYAAYEFHKERYARRTGSANLAFNPYPIPGFPCILFDQRSTQVDIFGYVMTVRQNLSSRGWSTQVAYSYGRTFQEVFDLLRRNVEIENEGLAADTARVQQAVETGNQASLATRAEPVGTIAVGPAEPIVEIRDVIQNFDRADAFYRALFYREAGPDASALSAQQANIETERRAVAESGVLSGPVAQEEVPLAIRRRSVVCRYNELVAYKNEDGTEDPIFIAGIDSSTRTQVLTNLAALRSGEASEAQIAFLQEALGRPSLTTGASAQEINSIETAVRLATTETNVDGGREFVVREEAQAVFSDYDTAMKYAARPICSLDEYIDFLGEAGLREGRIDPVISLRENEVRTFPAKYYLRIRQYRNGPPPPVPPVNITNSSFQSSAMDGVSSQEGNDVPSPPEGDVQGIPEDFPETRADWDTILLRYRSNVLNRLAPRN